MLDQLMCFFLPDLPELKMRTLNDSGLRTVVRKVRQGRIEAETSLGTSQTESGSRDGGAQTCRYSGCRATSRAIGSWAEPSLRNAKGVHDEVVEPQALKVISELFALEAGDFIQHALGLVQTAPGRRILQCLG